MSRKSKLSLVVFSLFLLFALSILSALFPAQGQTYLLEYIGNHSAGAYDLAANGTVFTQDFSIESTAKHIYLYFASKGTGRIHSAITDTVSGQTVYESGIDVQSSIFYQELTLGDSIAPGSYRLTLDVSDFAPDEGVYFTRREAGDQIPCQINGMSTDNILALAIASEGKVRAVPELAVVLLLLLIASAAIFKEKKLFLHLLLSLAVCVLLAGVGQLLPFNPRIPVLLGAFLGSCFLAEHCTPGLLSELWSFRRSIVYLGGMLLVSGIIAAVTELIFSSINSRIFLYPRCFFFAAVYFVIIYHLISRSRLNLAVSFLVISLSAGLYFSFFLPANTLVGWDDETHFSSTIGLSQGFHVTSSKAEQALTNRTIPPSFSLAQNAADNQFLEDQANVFSRWFSRSSWVPRQIGYLPFVLGIWLGQILSLPFWLCFCFGRAANAVFYTLCLYSGIRRLKSGKLILYLFGLIPTNLFLAAHYSYDAWVIALMSLAFAWFIGALQRPDEKISTAEIAVMLFAAMISCPPKAIYCFIIPIMLLMPRQKFENQRSYHQYLGGVLTAMFLVIFSYVVLFLLEGAFAASTDIRGGEDASSPDQVVFILSHPKEYTIILLTFLSEYLSPENSFYYTCHLAYLDGVELQIPILLLLLTAVLFDRSKPDLAYRTLIFKGGSAVFLFGTLCLVATALYITFSPVGYYTIIGCQPRYLLPLLYPAAALLGNIFQGNEKVRNALTYVIPGAAAVILFSEIWFSVAAQYTI